ncbi:MAG TPA: dipeptide epimerase [Candidatus Caenarcaniphilales bacterium]|nr:dipeptide epimerase [Candidatus Caenarcaniphilales bacterium]
MRVETEIVRVPLREPFRIARDENPEVATTVIVELELDGAIGRGEAFPVAYYGETATTVQAVLPLLVDSLAELGAPPAERAPALAWLERASALMDASLGHNGGAKCALDMALHDICGQRLGLPLHALLGMDGAVPPTDFSLGLDAPDVVAERARRAAHFPALKIKVGGADDVRTLEAVRGVYDGPLRVDANTGWRLDEGLELLPELERLGVELIEQPFRADEIGELRRLQEATRLPIVADESAVVITDLDRLAGVVAGVNVKLAKCGGVGPALRMIRRARELGFRVMLGCMEETSLGIRAAVAIASLAEWVDLDGCLLLAEDPFAGLELDGDCRWRQPETPGLGLRRVA